MHRAALAQLVLQGRGCEALQKHGAFGERVFLPEARDALGLNDHGHVVVLKGDFERGELPLGVRVGLKERLGVGVVVVAHGGGLVLEPPEALGAT